MSNDTCEIVAVFSRPDCGREFEQEQAKKKLKFMEQYNVKRIEVYPYYTDVYLRGIKGKFNSVMFDFFAGGEPYDPTSDRRNFALQTRAFTE